MRLDSSGRPPIARTITSRLLHGSGSLARTSAFGNSPELHECRKSRREADVYEKVLEGAQDRGQLSPHVLRRLHGWCPWHVRGAVRRWPSLFFVTFPLKRAPSVHYPVMHVVSLVGRDEPSSRRSWSCVLVQFPPCPRAPHGSQGGASAPGTACRGKGEQCVVGAAGGVSVGATRPAASPIPKTGVLRRPRLSPCCRYRHAAEMTGNPCRIGQLASNGKRGFVGGSAA